MSPKSELITEQMMFCGEFKTESIPGIHVFSCKDLKKGQSLFNDGLPSLIFMPQKSNTVQLTDHGEIVKYNYAWVCCGEIKNTHWEIPLDVEYILVLRFKPSDFYALFNIDPSVFHFNPIRNFEEIVSDHWMQFFDKMYEMKTISDRISYLDQGLSSPPINECFPYILIEAIQYIEDNKGNVTVSEVLNQLGKKVNTKWLHRNFVKYMGISPKKFISLQRFIYSYTQFEKSKSEDYSDKAFLSGYYDYNHFIKDFKGYIGVSPSQYHWE